MQNVTELLDVGEGRPLNLVKLVNDYFIVGILIDDGETVLRHCLFYDGFRRDFINNWPGSLVVTFHEEDVTNSKEVLDKIKQTAWSFLKDKKVSINCLYRGRVAKPEERSTGE